MAVAEHVIVLYFSLFTFYNSCGFCSAVSTEILMKRTRAITPTKNGTSPMNLKLANDILALLNAGKKAIGLKTEIPEEFLAMMMENESDASEQTGKKGFEGVLKHYGVKDMMNTSSNLQSEPDEEKILRLSSGENGIQVDENQQIKVNTSLKKDNGTEVQDLFEMFVENDTPPRDGRSGTIERIEIIERERWKSVDLDNKDGNSTLDTVRRSLRDRSLARPRRRRKREVAAASIMEQVVALSGQEPEGNEKLMGHHETILASNPNVLTYVLFSTALFLITIILAVGLFYAWKIAGNHTYSSSNSSKLHQNFTKKISQIIKEEKDKSRCQETAGAQYQSRNNPVSKEETCNGQITQSGKDDDGFIEVNLEWQDEFGNWD